MKNEKTNKEEIKINGKDLLSKIKKVIKEGNVKKITVKNSKDESVLSIPVTAGLLMLVIAPYLIIIASLTAYAIDYTLVIERKE